MPEAAIRAEGLSKQYRIGERQSAKTLRETITDAVRAPVRRAKKSGHETIWALKDVSFEVAPGEVVGVIGRNGAGKSTLLKILSRITEPTAGRAEIRGRIASLLEVGTGFHPELTGRENIYLNGAILGMKRVEIERKFDEIVAFAEVEKFIDTPVKHYSSGMYLRLAFAVAAHLEPEILLVDEVLAVGDATFQKKCLGKMSDVARHGRTILFVSHNSEAIRRLCGRALLIHKGRLLEDEASEVALQKYAAIDLAPSAFFVRDPATTGEQDWFIARASLSQDGRVTSTLRNEAMTSVLLELEGHESRKVSFEVMIRDQNFRPILFAPLGLAQALEHTLHPPRLSARIDLLLPYLAEGRYFVDLIIADTGRGFVDCVESALYFDLGPNFHPTTGWSFRQARDQGAVLLAAKSVQLTVAPSTIRSPGQVSGPGDQVSG